MMKTVFYKIECLTNLHVGSGDINYNIIDNEVEKDAVTGLPIIHASGVKGALRDALKGKEGINVNAIFGAPGSGETGNSGSHKFLDACLLSRPMRISGSDRTSSVSVVSVDSVNRFLKKLSAFGCNSFGVDKIEDVEFADNEFLTTYKNIKIEDEKTGELDEKTASALKWLAELIGGDFAIAKNFDGYALPVMARNSLDENGVSKNLWYEEVVPHGSIFYFAVIGPEELDFSDVIQFGGNASIGCGYTQITKIS